MRKYDLLISKVTFKSTLFPKKTLPFYFSLPFFSWRPLYFLLPDPHSSFLPYCHFSLFVLCNVNLSLNIWTQYPNICNNGLDIFNLKLTIQIKILLKDTPVCIWAKNISCWQIWVREYVWSRCIVLYQLVFPQRVILRSC